MNGVVSVWGYFTFHWMSNEFDVPTIDPNVFAGRKVITFIPNHVFTNPVDYDLAVNSEVCNGDTVKGAACEAFNVYSNGCQHSYAFNMPGSPLPEV